MQLRANVYYLQAYQIHLGDNWIQIFLAITSSTSIGGWVIWNEYGIIWGALIAVSQVINAIKRPFQKRAKQIGSLNTEVEKLALDAESQWFSVFNLPTRIFSTSSP